MITLVVRNVPGDVVEALRRRAQARGRSLEDEHRAMLIAALKPGRAGFAARAARLRAATRGRMTTDAGELIRADRDAR